jgi:hypothetical protein
MNREEMKKILEDLFYERLDMKKSMILHSTYGVYSKNFLQLGGYKQEKEPIVPSKEIRSHSCL